MSPLPRPSASSYSLSSEDILLADSLQNTPDFSLSAPDALDAFSASHANSLVRRQSTGDTIAIPLTYNFDGPNPGATVGITLGSVAAFLFIFWLIRTLSLSSRTGLIEGDTTTIIAAHSSHRSASYAASRSHRRRRRRHREPTVVEEMSESVASASAPPRRARTERIVIEETLRTERSAAPQRDDSTRADSIIAPPPEVVIERRVEGDDIVEVVEEQSSIGSERPPPQERRKRRSGYRTVDPNAYGGGNFAQHDIYDSRSRSRRR